MEDEKTEFKVGSGFDDARRANPPPVRQLLANTHDPLPLGVTPHPRLGEESSHSWSGRELTYTATLPQVGAIITYRFQDLTKAGVPRFPTFVGERFDVTGPKDAVLLEKNTGEEET
jgi:ATP-dependent DNA ligase